MVSANNATRNTDREIDRKEKNLVFTEIYEHL